MRENLGWLLRAVFVIASLLACEPLVGRYALSATSPAGLSYAANPVIYHRAVAIPPNVLGNSGGSATFSVTPALPSGLILDAQSGAISGTPQVASAQATYTVTATNDAGRAQVALTLAVSDTPPQLTFPAQSYSLVLGRSALIVPINSGGPITSCATVSPLPAGLQVDATTCAIVGTPATIAALAPVAIVATYGGGTVPAALSLAVVNGLSLFPPSVTLRGTPGETFAFASEGGVGPFLYSVVSGPGSIDGTGLFTPPNVRANTIIQVSDANGDKSTAAIKTLLPIVDDVVNAFAGDGSAFYLGGEFLHVDPEPASSVVALDAQAGTPLLAFDTQQSFDGPATAAVADSTGLYVVGAFRHYRGALANGIVKLDLATGAPAPAFNSGGGFDIEPIAMVSDASALYVTGNFSGYAGTAAGSVVKINAQSGAVDTQFHGTMSPHCIRCHIVVHDTTLFIAQSGVLNQKYNGQTGTLFAVDTTTGIASALPNQPSLMFIGAIAADDEGLFAVVSGKIYKLDFNDGGPLPTFTTIVTTTSVSTLIADSGILYVGFDDGTIGRYDSHSGIAGANMGTVFGTTDTYGSTAIDVITPLADGIAVGGSFTLASGVITSRVAKLSRTDGTVVSAFSSLGVGGHLQAETMVSAIVATPQGLFLAGDFTSVGGTLQPHLAKFSGATLAADPIFTAAPPNKPVTALALTGDDLYVGGGFDFLGTTCLAGLRKLNARTGAVESFASYLGSSACDPDINVTALVADATGVAVAGDFTALQRSGSAVSASHGASWMDPTGTTATPYVLSDMAVSLAVARPVGPGTALNCIFVGTQSTIENAQWNRAVGANACPTSPARATPGAVIGIVPLGSGVVDIMTSTGVYQTNYNLGAVSSGVATSKTGLNTVTLDAQDGLVIGGTMQDFSVTSGTVSVEGLVSCDIGGSAITSPLGQVTGQGSGAVYAVASLFGEIFAGGDFSTRAGVMAPFAAFLDARTGAVVR